ncbi:MAG: hypothetical protein Q7U15_05940 [Methylotenera sp.]|nr:hypothetical protein [Methylotenera sp.]
MTAPTESWQKWGEYAIKTETHSICKVMVANAWVYCLYKLPAQLIGTYPSANAAKWSLKNMVADNG